MKIDRPLTLGQKKKALDEKKVIEVIASVLGSIRAYIPETQEDFVRSLKENRPELYDRAVEKGIIRIKDSEGGQTVVSTYHSFVPGLLDPV